MSGTPGLIRVYPCLSVVEISGRGRVFGGEKKLLDLFTWTANVQPCLRGWADDEYKGILPGHVGTGTGGGGLLVDAGAASRGGEEDAPVGAAARCERGYFRASFRTASETFFKSRPAPEAGFELGGARDWMTFLATSKLGLSFRSRAASCW